MTIDVFDRDNVWKTSGFILGTPPPPPPPPPTPDPVLATGPYPSPVWTASTSTTASITWAAVPNATEYRVYDAMTGTQVAAGITTLGYTMTGMAAGATRYLQGTAVIGGIENQRGPIVTVFPDSAAVGKGPVAIFPGANLDLTQPAGSTLVPVGSNLRTMVNNAGAGTVFFFATGTHRGLNYMGISPKPNMQFIGARGAIIKGSYVIVDTGWTNNGNGTYSKTIPVVGPATPYGQHRAGHSSENFPVEANIYRAETPAELAAAPCMYADDLIVDGRMAWRVGTQAELTGSLVVPNWAVTAANPPRWWHSYTTGEVRINFNPTGHLFEKMYTGAETNQAFARGDMTMFLNWDPGISGGGTGDIIVKNLRLEQFASGEGAPVRAVINAVDSGGGYNNQYVLNGPNLTTGRVFAQNCEFRDNHGFAYFMGSGGRSSDCIYERNGHGWIKGLGRGMVVERNVARQNNYMEHYDTAWEAVFKFALTSTTTIDHCIIDANYGIGLWWDYSYGGQLINRCAITNHEQPPFLIEMTGRTEEIYIQDNLFSGNNFRQTTGGAYPASAGGSINNSREVNYIRNYADGGGLMASFQERGCINPEQGLGTGSGWDGTTCTGAPWARHGDLTGLVVQNNIFVVAAGRKWGWHGLVATPTQDFTPFNLQPSTYVPAELAKIATGLYNNNTYRIGSFGTNGGSPEFNDTSRFFVGLNDITGSNCGIAGNPYCQCSQRYYGFADWKSRQAANGNGFAPDVNSTMV